MLASDTVTTTTSLFQVNFAVPVPCWFCSTCSGREPVVIRGGIDTVTTLMNGNVVNVCTVSQSRYKTTGCLCVDDAVYLSSGDEHLQIIRIDKLWTNSK